MFTVIDLSETLYQGIPVVVEKIRDNYEDPPFYVEQWANVPDKGYSVHAVHLGTHTGTHVDAPSHFYLNTPNIDEIEPSAFVGKAVIMNFTGQGNITKEMVKPFKKRVKNPANIAVIISNVDEYLSIEASNEIISWKPKSLMIACGFNEPDELYTKSVMFLKAEIPLIQKVLVEKAQTLIDGDLIVAAPLKLLGMDAAPARVFAIRL